MLQSKRAFEKYSSSHGIQIKNHRADNGKLSYNAFLQSCNNEGQTPPFCGVNIRWQNGVAKKKKKDLQYQARIMTLHAKTRYP